MKFKLKRTVFLLCRKQYLYNVQCRRSVLGKITRYGQPSLIEGYLNLIFQHQSVIYIIYIIIEVFRLKLLLY